MTITTDLDWQDLDRLKALCSKFDPAYERTTDGLTNEQKILVYRALSEYWERHVHVLSTRCNRCHEELSVRVEEHECKE